MGWRSGDDSSPGSSLMRAYRCGRHSSTRGPLAALSELRPGRIHALKDLTGSLHDEGIAFLVARLKGPTGRPFGDVGLLDVIGEGHIDPTVRAAV